VKRYADVGDQIVIALRNYASDVRTSRFPEDRHTYSMPQPELERFEALTGRLTEIEEEIPTSLR
jgi:hypothetical protein